MAVGTGDAVHTLQGEPRSDALAAAQEAFDLSWAEIAKVEGGYDLGLARDLIAKLIVDAALKGERDPVRLKAFALAGFGP
jgi:hypothetical protein